MPDRIPAIRDLYWGVFVGRREEMDQLKDALEGALSGKGSLSMLVGGPGIGKTRLAEQFGAYAGLRGAQLLTGHCYEGEASLPYRPFVEAFRQYTRSRPDAELRSQLGPGAPEIATLVSEIRQRFPDIEEAPELDPEAERLRLFDSVSKFLHNASTAQPLVLHPDDLHWADKPSLLLLQHLAQRTARDRLLILGAYRHVDLGHTHSLSETLGALRRLPNYRRVLLRGLPQESVFDLLTVIEPNEETEAGRQALSAALYRETDGNPFFIREVLAHLIETGMIVRENGRWVGKVRSVSDLDIPDDVGEVIGRRLARLSDGCNKMLTLASTMTGGFSWEALKEINADVPEAELLDLLEEALSAQVIVERTGEPGRYEFTHALIRTSIDNVARAVDRERPDIASHAAPDGTVTIMFSDIEDSTVLTERLGDEGWMDVLRRHNALIREQIAAHDGYEVKTIGDAFMVAFRSAKKGLDCAIAIQRAFASSPLLHGLERGPGGEVRVRIGLHADEAIKDGDDFYGKNVILASRVAGKAVGGEILVSSLLRQLVESSVGASVFGEPRDVELKGLSGTHTVYAVGSA